jgi:spermidine synthase
MLIGSAHIPGGGQLQLVRHGQDFEILLGGEQLMGNWATRSERALATLVCERLGSRATRMLIGGLGMGFTLAAALEALPAEASVEVAELVPGIVEWAKGPLAHIFRGSLADHRVKLHLGDVHDLIASRPSSFDAILLDVDNGPDGFVTVANERLYSGWGLREAFAALHPGGVLAIWSANPDTGFPSRLAGVGFQVEEVKVVDSDGDEQLVHTIWLAAKP